MSSSNTKRFRHRPHLQRTDHKRNQSIYKYHYSTAWTLWKMRRMGFSIIKY